MPTSHAPPSKINKPSPNSDATCAARGRADSPKQIGAGCRHTHHAQASAALNTACATGWRRATQTHRVLAASRHRRLIGLARQDQGERARPKSGHQLLGKRGDLAGKPLCTLHTGHMARSAGGCWAVLWLEKSCPPPHRCRRLPPSHTRFRWASQPNRHAAKPAQLA